MNIPRYIVLILTTPYGNIDKVIYCQTLTAAEEIKRLILPNQNTDTVEIIQDYDAAASIDPAYYEAITDGNLR